MIERARGWLDTGGRAVLRGSKKHSRSRRHLHSAFWSHGAGNIDLPSWWMLSLQHSSSTQESFGNKKHGTATAALSSGLQEIFLDFLYSVQTLALIRPLKRSTNAQHQAAQSIKHCSRSYTSIAADFINGSKAFGTATRRRDQDASTRSSSETPQPGDAIRRRINEMLGSKDHTWIYDELWQSYQALREMSQPLLPQELIKMLRCLGTSQRTVDVERAVALFDSIPVQQRRAIHYSYAVSAALSLRDLDTAVDIHREALTRTGGSIGTAAVLTYTVQHEKWQLAIDTWHPYWVGGLHYYTRPDIWTGVNSLSLPDLMQKAISAADFAISTADFAISTAESSQQENAVAARDFALELIRQTLCIQNTDFNIHNHWRLIQRARNLDASDMMTQTMALRQLLSVNSRGHGHRALYLYRTLRKDSTFLPSPDLLSLVTGKLVAEKSSLGMFMMIEDWRTYHQKVPPGIAINVAKVFAQLGQLEPLQNLFRDFCSLYGTPTKLAWYHILLFVHNRRADPEGIVHAFNDLQKTFHFKPTLQAWNYVIGTFSRIGDIDGALSWFNKLLETELRPDSRTYFLLMSSYAKRGDMETVHDLYQQSKMDGIKTTMLMIDSIVLATIKDERLADAEQLVKEALQMDLEGSRTFMWTILLNAYALRKELEKVSDLHKQMQESGVASNGMTYAALMTSLAIAKMPEAAYKILDKVMPRAQIKRTSLHYAIVMGGYLATRSYGKIFRVYKDMLSRNLGPTMSTQNVLLRAAASVDKANQDSDKDPEIQTELVRAQQTFEQTISNLDPMELAASEPRKFVGPNPLNEAFFSTYYEYLIFLYAKDAAFSKVTELYERYISTSARFSNREVEASPPIGILSALMVAHLRAGDHEEVERCWYLALDKSEKLACRARAVTSEPGWVLHSRRLIMNVPLHHYILSLGGRSRIDDLISTIKQLHSSGFALTSLNWNLYIQHLAQSSEARHQLLAFELCERELIPNWPGWDTLGDPKYATKKLKAVTDSGSRVLAGKAGNSSYPATELDWGSAKDGGRAQ
ncbi:MAG: hypothetical protein Q9175_002254 [Cornicularia normoerica]